MSLVAPRSPSRERELKQPVLDSVHERLLKSDESEPVEKDPGCCSCLVCCFGCLTFCGCRDWVCRKLVFFPPPCQYAVQLEVRESGMDSAVKQHVMYIRDEAGRLSDPHGGPDFSVYTVLTKRQQRICSTMIRHREAKTTILLSHGNATDLGFLRNHLLEISMALQVNVYAYDYTGYGLSTNYGRPTVADTTADAEAAFDHVTKELGVAVSDLVLYGQSLGTGPTLHLARKFNVKAVVIHSGIMSGLRVIRPYLESTYWFDIFPNIDLIAECRAPVFVIHGTEDEEINIRHGIQLYLSSNKKVQPWWVPGGGHNDIEFESRSLYFEKLRNFLNTLDGKQNNNNVIIHQPMEHPRNIEITHDDSKPEESQLKNASA